VASRGQPAATDSFAETIPAISFQYIEALKEGFAQPAAAAKFIEGSDAVGPADCHLIVERERSGPEHRGRRCRDGQEPFCAIIAALCQAVSLTSELCQPLNWRAIFGIIQL